MANNLVSIIIPCFNSEKKIRRCITSLLNQEYTNIEIVAVNDGSTDKTLQILNAFAACDIRMKVFSNENHGVSYSRNFGISKANGEFICFVDSDDCVLKNYVSTLLETAEHGSYDLVVCGYESADGLIHCQPDDREFNVNDEIETFIYETMIRTNYLNPPWNKIFKKSKILNTFPEEFSLGEDVIFNCEYAFNAKRVKIISDVLYKYDTSGSNKLTTKFTKNSLSAIKYLYVLLENKLTSGKEVAYEFKRYFIGKLIECINLLFFSDYTRKLKKQIFNSIVNDAFWIEMMSDFLQSNNSLDYYAEATEILLSKKYSRYFSFLFKHRIKKKIFRRNEGAFRDRDL